MTDDRDKTQPLRDPGTGREETLRTAAGMAATAFGQTDVGRQRTVNQDTLGNRVGQHAEQAASLGLLYAIADGMGGHARGEVASAMAIDQLFARFYAGNVGEDPRRVLSKVLVETNNAVYQAGREAGGPSMGTTLTTALLRDDALYVGNIGDSRTYCIRAGQIEQLTHDHSLIGEQVRSGLLTEEQARQSTVRNVITRAVGYRDEVEPDVFTFPIAAGDIVLLCSDGLHTMVDNQELAQALSTRPLTSAVSGLIELAKQRGGPDNITALAVRVDQLANAVAMGSGETTTVPVTPSLNDAITKPTVRMEGGEVADTAISDDAPTAPIAPVGRVAAPHVVPPAPPPAVPPPASAPLIPVPSPPRKQTGRFPAALLVVLPLLVLTALGAGFVAYAGRDQGPSRGTVIAADPTTGAAAGAVATPLSTVTASQPSVAVAAASNATTRTPQATGATLQPTPLPGGTAPATGTTAGGSEPRPSGTMPLLLTGTIQFRPPLNPGQAMRIPEEWEVVVFATSTFPPGFPERPTDEQLAGMPTTWRGAIKPPSLSGNFGYDVQGEWSLTSDQGTFLVALRHKAMPSRFLLPEPTQLRVTFGSRQAPFTHNLAITEPIE